MVKVESNQICHKFITIDSVFWEDKRDKIPKPNEIVFFEGHVVSLLYNVSPRSVKQAYPFDLFAQFF